MRAVDPAVKLSVSVQVDYAWGWGSNGAFLGVATDFADFPFIQEFRSEERRVGKECRSRWSPYH